MDERCGPAAVAEGYCGGVVRAATLKNTGNRCVNKVTNSKGAAVAGSLVERQQTHGVPGGGGVPVVVKTVVVAEGI